jgi:GT2 family glycosyltransferase
MSGKPALTVIIVSWNVREHVLACLRALEADGEAPELEVIVVDNASSDETVPDILEQHPKVKVIANRTNVGFPRANNQALARASGAYVLFLNPDTEVRPGTLRACVEALESDPVVGLVGCRLEFPDGTIQYEGARNTYRFRHLVYETFYLHMLFPRSPRFAHQLMGDWDHRGVRDVEAVSGAFMMTRTDLARALGGLPDEVFMYHEDLSFCLRVLRTGRRIRYQGDVATVHHSRQSSTKSPAHLALLDVECRLRFIREADGPLWGAAARAVLALRAALRVGLGCAGVLLPERLKRKYPRVFDLRTHWLQLVWSISPAFVTERIPRVPDHVDDPVLAGAW